MNPIFHIPDALRHRSYALYWTALIISISGSQMQFAALLWHLRTLSDQPVVVSGIGLVRFLPILLLAPMGGIIADSFNRRKIVFLTQACMVLVAASLGLLTWLGVIKVWHIYILSGIQAAAIAFDTPARQSLVPHLVPRKDLTNAFSMQSIAVNSGSIIGPALSGLVIGTLGQEYTYWLNAISFVAVLAALVIIGPIHHEIRAGSFSLEDNLKSIREGAHYVFRQPILFSSMLLDFIATFFSSATTLLPFVAQDILHVGAVAYGWLVAAQAAGGVLVGVVLSQRRQLYRQGTILLGAVVVYGSATILFGMAKAFAAALAALMLVGAADAVSTILRNTIRQLQTPDAMRGRMVSINQIFFMGGPQLGEIEAGLAAQAFGIPFAVISGGVGCILGAIWVALRWPQLRGYVNTPAIRAGAPAD